MPNRPASVTPEQMKIIRDRKMAGLTWLAISKELGLTKYLVVHYGYRLGIKAPHPNAAARLEAEAKGVPTKHIMAQRESENLSKLIPRGQPTLPPLPCLQEPIHVIQNK